MNKIKRFSDELRDIADRMDDYENYIIQYVHDHFIRPLQECRIYTKNEVAEKLHVSPSYVSKLIKTGMLQTTADGRITHYHLREYIKLNPPNKSP